METFTRLFVLFGYLAVAVNAAMLSRRGLSGGRAALWAFMPATLFWAAFYGHVTFSEINPELLVQWSRLGHTLTIGGFLFAQYVMARCRKSELERVVRLIEREVDLP